jgi:uncharacterized OsmC-like protein
VDGIRFRDCARISRPSVLREDPHRILRATLHFKIDGDVPADAVDRAIALSRDKYCSVWHSVRQDIDIKITWERDSGPSPSL